LAGKKLDFKRKVQFNAKYNDVILEIQKKWK